MKSVDSATVCSSIALTTPPAIAAALPHLLGFHPQESLICLWMKDGELVVVQRADLMPSSHEREYSQAYLEAAANVPADEVTIVCVTRAVSHGLRVVREVSGLVGLMVRSALIVCGGRVRSVEADTRWQWISAYDRQSAAEAFGGNRHERVIRRSRGEVVAEVEYDGRTDWEVPRSTEARLEALCDLLARGELTGLKVRRELRDSTLDVAGRDLVMWWCGRVSMEKRRELLEALLVGLRATPRGRGSHLACAAAATAWMCGDGVRANAALDRCLSEDPSHSMGRILESAMAAAVPPSEYVAIVTDIPPQLVGATQAVVDSVGA